jgi:hypothetical protein
VAIGQLRYLHMLRYAASQPSILSIERSIGRDEPKPAGTDRLYVIGSIGRQIFRRTGTTYLVPAACELP